MAASRNVGAGCCSGGLTGADSLPPAGLLIACAWPLVRDAKIRTQILRDCKFGRASSSTRPPCPSSPPARLNALQPSACRSHRGCTHKPRPPLNSTGTLLVTPCWPQPPDAVPPSRGLLCSPVLSPQHHQHAPSTPYGPPRCCTTMSSPVHTTSSLLWHAPLFPLSSSHGDSRPLPSPSLFSRPSACQQEASPSSPADSPT